MSNLENNQYEGIWKKGKLISKHLVSDISMLRINSKQSQSSYLLMKPSPKNNNGEDDNFLKSPSK